MRRLPLVVALLLLAACAAERVASLPRPTVAPPVETLAPTLQGLRVRFDVTADWPRLVLLLSPS